ncbi:hypothetical protein MACJ_001573 [Theileria orientalis]|uniref:ABC transporter domain-containing protein n=1 Tax=Theileria orientalis TaxID=68886 RepID=A0A976M8U4_THEOR|nr:hypothetical protein MACJ_001573 [Theileria orientalis]
MNKRSTDRTLIIEDDPESFFWDSQLYRKSDFNDRKNRSYRYYDETSFLKYLFFHWVNKWAFVLSEKYVDPYKYHPLPCSDHVFKWYPIFSKHVSDGLVRRMGIYIKDCSPNFYICDNKFTGSTSVGSVVGDTTNQLPKDSVVYYKDATFTWVHTRDDLLNKKYEPFLRNVNFELKRGQMAIVTGSKGSGKSNFIKSMLGEMTLVGGSMAVVPLHTSMPIFYASQDIFLQQGTIRSNIVFGYKFDQQLYNAVLKAVELEYDISTWEKGDLRVLSDRAHLLSGGQRVRMEMARALYAYLIFHQVNSDYNNNKCSFLMCLDSLFQGLGPYVSKNIFNNLFNLKTGMLIKNDLSVVLTVSKQCLDLCSKTSDVTQIPNAPVYNINNQTLKFYSNLHDFVKNNKVDNIDYNYLSPNIGCCDIHFLTNDMLSLCSSGLTNKPVRMELTREKYSESFKSQSNDDVSGVKSFTYGCAQMLMGSIERFQYFIPAGQKLKFSKCINTNEEYVVNPSDKNVDFLDKKRMLQRRLIEFKAENKKYYLLRRLFYHPKIQIVDVDNYITTNHTGVELRDVCVYTTIDPNPESMILKHITVSSVKSEIIGIIGRTGAGKTTLLSVLQNIAENRTGQVLLDGKDLNDIPKFVLRQVIGVIPQLPFVFKGWTLRRFLDPRRLFSDEEINDALDKCGLDFVNTLPGSKRLETIIIPDGDLFYSQSSKNRSNLNKHAKESSEFKEPSFDRGTLLSNNQLRTLSLARLVLYKNFYKMIVVDEPPEEDLLYETYKKDDPEIRIYDILQKHFSHCTTFVTAHDVNALKTCTSVWVIHGGSLVKTCKTSDITANESIAKIIEECVKYSH